MTPQGPYRVVGVTSDGKRTLISTHHTREAAERLVRLAWIGERIGKLLVETGAEPSSEKPRQKA